MLLESYCRFPRQVFDAGSFDIRYAEMNSSSIRLKFLDDCLHEG